MALLKSAKEAMQPGDSAPEFTMKNIDGSEVSLSQFKGTPVCVLFMCNHCPYVIPKFDEIAQLQKEFEGKAVILCVNSNDTELYQADSFENMQKLAQEKGYKYYLLDETQKVAKAYGAVCTPDLFVFDKDHKLVYHGRINDAMDPDAQPQKHELHEVLTKVTGGSQVENWFEPSQGCSIKWRRGFLSRFLR